MNILILKVHSNFKHEVDVLQMLICEIFEALGIFGSDRWQEPKERVSPVCLRVCVRVSLCDIIQNNSQKEF